MDAGTIGAFAAIALAIKETVVTVTRFLSDESKARRAEKKAKKDFEKAQKARRRAELEAARKVEGLAYEKGGSRLGREARAAWDKKQRQRQKE